MARCPRLAQEMVGKANPSKADGPHKSDVICTLGIRELTFCPCIGDPKNGPQRTSSVLQKRWEHVQAQAATTIH